jgi:cobalamin biosynthesis Mg chelatase CobN
MGTLQAWIRSQGGALSLPEAAEAATPGDVLGRRRRATDEDAEAGMPQILKFMPGTAQDLRAYFLSLQYWLAGSDENVANLVRMLVDRYADGPRRGLRGTLKVRAPIDYPDVGVYHPAMPGRLGEHVEKLPASAGPARGRIGLLGHALLPDRRQCRPL